MSDMWIDPEAAFRRMSSWSDKVGDAFNSASAAFSAITELSLGADGFSKSAVRFVNGVRGVQSQVQAVARAATDADLGGTSSYDMVQAAIAGALAGATTGGTSQAELVAQAEEYAAMFPAPEDAEATPDTETVQEMADFLEENRDNEEVITAFYDAVPAENLLAFVQDLGLMDNQDDAVKKSQHDVMIQLGNTLGDASSKGWVSNQYAEDLVSAMTTLDGEDDRYSAGWALAEVLQNGLFGTEFLETVGEGVLAAEQEYKDNKGESPWFGRAGFVPPLGYTGMQPRNPVDAAMQAMIRNPDRAALQGFLYPSGQDADGQEERQAYLIDRIDHETWTSADYSTLARAFERLAIPDAGADEAAKRLAGTVAVDAVRVLPVAYGGEPTDAVRGSMANILTAYWPAVDALIRQSAEGDDEYNGAGLSPEMGLEAETGRLKFTTRDQVEDALGMAMDLGDFDANNAAIGKSPSARVIAAASNFNDFRVRWALESAVEDPVEDPVRSVALTKDEVGATLKENLVTLGFVTQAGFQDEIADAAARDANLATLRSFTIEAVKTAATIGGSAAGTSVAGPTGGSVAGAGTGWATNRALESWIPKPNSADGMNTTLCETSAGIVWAASASWASTVWATPNLPADMSINRTEVAENPGTLEDQEQRDATDLVLNKYSLKPENLDSSFHGGRTRAKPGVAEINTSSCSD